MAKNKRRRFETWKDAEVAYDALSKISSALDTALHALVRGKVKWIEGEQPRKIGLCRLEATHGGVVILAERERVDAQYLDEWANRVQATPAPKSKTYHQEYKAWLDIRRLAAMAVDERRIVLEKSAEMAKGSQRIQLSGEVDQDVRSY